MGQNNQLGPHLEAGAASVQSNLNAQVNVKAYCKYVKNIMFDRSTDTDAEANNVFLIAWADDALRAPAAVNPITYSFKGEIKTFWNELF